MSFYYGNKGDYIPKRKDNYVFPEKSPTLDTHNQ